MRRHLLFASAVLLVCFAVNAKADCAPPAPAKDERKKLDTEGAIAKLWKRFDRLKGGVNVEIEKKEIFSAYPNADQIVVLLTVLYNACASHFQTRKS